jgi:hypothetical protein
MKLTAADVWRDIEQLKTNLSVRDVKFRRNFNRYCNNGRRSEDVFNPYGQPLSFYYAQTDDDTGVIPVLNYAKSTVDTHISKLSQTKVRPYFNSINGSFRTRKTVRNAQLYFDELYNAQDVYKKAIEAARDAEIFEVGHLWVDDETESIRRVRPWEVYYDRAEWQNDKLNRIFLYFRNFPLYYLEDKIANKNIPEANLLNDKNLMVKCDYYVYFDLKNKKKYEFVNGNLIKEQKTSFDTSPIVFIHYSPPVKGGFTTSLIDEIYTLQTEIDMIAHRIHTAFSLNPANQVFVPKGSDVKASSINNEIGSIYEYIPAPGVTTPVIVSTPPAISPQYLEYLNFCRGEIYGIAGISQLSAQAKKPAGLNSGVALDTLEDVESERHNLVLQNYILFLMKVAKTCIDVYPEDDDILPRKIGTARMTWKDVKRERDNMTIQFSPASALSKDPKVKMEQIEKMIAMRMIPADRAAEMMEIPDLEKEFSIETASLDVCERIVERAVEDGTYDFYETVNIQQLFSLVNFYINRFDANDEDRKVLDNLVTLYNIIKSKINEVNAAVVQSTQSTLSGNMAPPTAPGPTNALPLQPGQ